MRVMITVLILLSSIYSSNASSIFDIQNEIYIDNVSQLPVSSNLIPDKAWSPSQEYFAENCRRAKNPYFLTGWIDIIGFKNLSQKNGTFYLRGDPSNEAIVQYEVNVCALGYPRFKGGFENKLDTYQQGKHFVARLTSTAILYYYIEGHKYYDNITRVFYDYEELPLKIESNNKDIEVTIIENNYTIINSTEISIDIDNSVFDQYLVKAE